jgi:hypothetical protein
MNGEASPTLIVVHLCNEKWGQLNVKSDINVKIGDFMSTNNLDGSLVSIHTMKVMDKAKHFGDYEFMTTSGIAQKLDTFVANYVLFVGR